jgi:hypothetical protein
MWSFVGKPEGKKIPLQKPTLRDGDNIKMDLREIGFSNSSSVKIVIML